MWKRASWLCQTFGISFENYSPAKSRIKAIRNKKRLKLEDVEKPFSKDVAQWILDNNSLTEKGKQFLFGKRFLNTRDSKQLNIVSIDDSKLLVEKGQGFRFRNLARIVVS